MNASHSDYTVGMFVAVQSYGWTAPEKHRVARVLRRFVELDDGSRWDHHGFPYPRNRSEYQRAEPWTDTHTRAWLAAEAAMVARNIAERLGERNPNVAEALPLVDQLNGLIEKLGK